LRKDLDLEKSRVIALAGLCEPIDMLIALVDDMCNKEAVNLEAEMAKCDGDLPSYEYSRIYNTKVRDTIAKLWIQRQRRNNATGPEFDNQITGEADAIVRVILQWVNFISRECSTTLEPTTQKPLDDFLQKHEQVYDILQLRNGRTLARIVVSLVFNAAVPLHQGATLVRGAAALRTLTVDQLHEIKDLENDERGLVRLTLEHAAHFLGVPLFKVTDIINGSSETIHSLVGYLLLATAQQRSVKDAQENESLKSQCEAIKFAFHQVEDRVKLLQTIADVQDAWADIAAGGVPARRQAMAASKEEGDAASRRPSIIATSRRGSSNGNSADYLNQTKKVRSTHIYTNQPTDQPI
jgi:hypothetical protein